MTIAEIEHTLRALCLRHQKLDTELLVTLLTAGGWEDKVIKDAITLFNASPEKYRPGIAMPVQATEEVPVSAKEVQSIPSPAQAGDLAIPVPVFVSDTVTPAALPVSSSLSDIVYYDSGGQEEKELAQLENVNTDELVRENKIMTPHKEVSLPPETQASDLEIHKENAPSMIEGNPQSSVDKIEKVPVAPVHIEINPPVIEPQSLIIPEVTHRTVPDQATPPENLPLKPFEATSHVWPFSKYKEVFHGEVMTPLSESERALVKEVTKENIDTVVVPKKITVKRTGFDGEDEGLIFLTATTLLIILLLLAYMYSNGRI